MALWINGGQVRTVDADGVTLMVRVLRAKDMVSYLKRAQIDPTVDGAMEEYRALIMEGIQGWAGDNAPEFTPDAIDNLSLGAMQRIVTTVIEQNSLTGTERGNSHAS